MWAVPVRGRGASQHPWGPLALWQGGLESAEVSVASGPTEEAQHHHWGCWKCGGKVGKPAACVWAVNCKHCFAPRVGPLCSSMWPRRPRSGVGGAGSPVFCLRTSNRGGRFTNSIAKVMELEMNYLKSSKRGLGWSFVSTGLGHRGVPDGPWHDMWGVSPGVPGRGGVDIWKGWPRDAGGPRPSHRGLDEVKVPCGNGSSRPASRPRWRPQASPGSPGVTWSAPGPNSSRLSRLREFNLRNCRSRPLNHSLTCCMAHSREISVESNIWFHSKYRNNYGPWGVCATPHPMMAYRPMMRKGWETADSLMGGSDSVTAFALRMDSGSSHGRMCR